MKLLQSLKIDCSLQELVTENYVNDGHGQKWIEVVGGYYLLSSIDKLRNLCGLDQWMHLTQCCVDCVSPYTAAPLKLTKMIS